MSYVWYQHILDRVFQVFYVFSLSQREQGEIFEAEIMFLKTFTERFDLLSGLFLQATHSK